MFFSTDSRKSLVTHVGIYEGAGIMIDASKRHGRVRRDDLNDEYWVARFMFARRLARGDVRIPATEPLTAREASLEVTDAVRPFACWSGSPRACCGVPGRNPASSKVTSLCSVPRLHGPVA